jgi:hypothetical protein
VVWAHGKEEPEKFQKHLKSIYPNIRFTMETEESNLLPFLDVLQKEKAKQLAETVYRNATHKACQFLPSTSTKLCCSFHTHSKGQDHM